MTDNRWTLLSSAFLALIAKTPPVQVYRVRHLMDFAKLQEDIDAAEFLLSIAAELVALQMRLERERETV